MFIEKSNVFETAIAPAEDITDPIRVSYKTACGMAAGTMVETNSGWRLVETLQEDDLIYTYDGGLKPLRRVESALMTAKGFAQNRTAPIHVPAGALGNCSALVLMPDQPVLLRGADVREVTQLPFVQVKVKQLRGYLGIGERRTLEPHQMFSLSFDEDEAVWAQTGALLVCPRHASGQETGFHAANTWEMRMILNGLADLKAA